MPNLNSYKFFIGNSMLPKIKTGFKVKSECVGPAEILIGDIVIFDRIKLICHRIVGRFKIGDKFYFLERGDNINCGLNWVGEKNILGKVTEVETLDRTILRGKDFAISDIEKIKFRVFSIIYATMYIIKLFLFGRRKNKITKYIYFLFAKIYNLLIYTPL